MTSRKLNLRIPGPTPLPPQVLKSMSLPMINHRGKDYEEMQKRIIKNLQYFFGTENDIYLLTSSGMGGLESAIVNFFSTGEKVLFLTCGEFGNRWAEIGKRYNLEVLHEKVIPGKGLETIEVENILGKNKNINAVFITLNETSSGVLNNVAQLSKIIHQHPNNPLILVDGISALGAVDLPMDELGIDVLVTASQKAWMAAPGLAMISASQKAWNKYPKSDLPKYYFDLKMYSEFNIKNQTPATPGVSTLFGLDMALGMMRQEGKEKIFKKHLMMRDYLREKIRGLGLELYVEEKYASPTVTSIKLPDGVDGHKWLQILREKYNTILAGGMGETKGKIIRVAHMGYVSKKDLDDVINALKKSLQDLK